MSSPRRIKDRAAYILDLVDRQGSASYEALAEMLQVSTMTIRRDCEELFRLEKIIKTMGGIQRAHAPAYLYEDPVRARIATNREQKRANRRKGARADLGRSRRFISMAGLPIWRWQN